MPKVQGKKMSTANLFESLEKRQLMTTALPAAPTNLKCVASSSTALTLQWTDNAGNETGYAVFRSADGANFSQINTIGANETTYVNGKLKTGTHYWYRVAAVNAAGQSKTSKTAEGIPTPQTSQPPPTSSLPAPGNVKATSSSATAITLTWNTDASQVTGYKIERSPDGVNFKQLNIVDGTTTSYVNGKLVTGAPYYYRVRGFDASGDGTYSAIVTATPGASTTPPPVTLPAPSGLTATASSPTAITLNWTDMSSETGYKVERSLDGVSFKQINSVAANTTSYANGKLTTGVKYYYRIRAFNNAGDGAYTSTVNATTVAAPPPPPPNLTAPNMLQTAALSSTAISITWADNATSETGYAIEHSTDNKTFNVVNTTAANTTGYIDTNLKPSTKYTRIRRHR